MKKINPIQLIPFWTENVIFVIIPSEQTVRGKGDGGLAYAVLNMKNDVLNMKNASTHHF